MLHLPLPSSPEFTRFTAMLAADQFGRQLAAHSGVPLDRTTYLLDMALGESAQTLRVLAGADLPDGARLLEVGAGIGVTSSFLSLQGFDITALEPGGPGFEQYVALAAALRELVGSTHATLAIPAEQLGADDHGRFDLVFSNNVIEHVEDPAVVLAATLRASAPGALGVHSCANYTIPYEPHFGIPLVPGRPAWTERLLPSSIRTSGLWRSLNFITARDVVEVARREGCSVTFRPAALATSLERLATDEQFRGRHRALAVVAAVLLRLGAGPVLRRLPPTWSTPMDFVLHHESERPRLAGWLHPSLQEVSGHTDRS